MDAVDGSLLRPEPLLLAAAVLLLIAAKIFTAWTYRLSLLSLGRDLGFREVLAARMASLPGRYVPGRIAATGGLAVLLSRFGIPASEAVAASLIPVLLNLLVGLVLSLPLLFMHAGGGAPLLPGWPALLPAVLLLAALLHPGLLFRGIAALLRRMRKPPIPPPSGPVLLRTALVIAVGYAASGGVLYLLALSLEPVPAALLPLFLFANACSFAAGFLVFFVPAGLGIRESALLVLLEAPVPGIALAAVCFRAIDVASDILLGAAGTFLVGRSLRNGTPSAGAAPQEGGA